MRKFVTSSIVLASGVLIAGLPIIGATADAQRGGGRSGGASARQPVSAGASSNRSSTPQARSQSSFLSVNNNRGTQTANRGNQNVNRDTNVNVDRNVNVDIDNDWDNN